ncbi:MAG: PAS domain S-box protein [Actinomycetota bacterium]
MSNQPLTHEEQRQYYESLIEVSPTAIVTGDQKLMVTSWNPAAERLFGYTRDEAMGRPINDLVANSDEVRAEAEAVDSDIRYGPVQLVGRRTRKDGSFVDVSIRAAPIVVGNELAGFYAFFDDITELVRQRRYFESLLEISPAAVVVVDRDFQVSSWNPAAEELFGYAADEAVGGNLDDMIAQQPELHEEAVRYSEEAWHSPIFNRITRRTRKDGSLVDVEISAVPVMLEDEAIGYYIIYHDVTELVRQRRFFESLVEVSPAAVVMVDESFTVRAWNPAAERLFGYSAAEAVGRNIDDLVANHPEVAEEARRFSREGWQSANFRQLARRTRKDGTFVDVEISAVPVTMEGERTGYVVYHDITDLQEARRQLEARIDEQMAELVRSGELARFIPRQVAEGLLAGQLAPEQPLERRRVTILFADMVGFTDLSETLEPEELSEVLNEYLREMTASVIAHGGTLDSFIGDGIMAVFGAPERVPETEQAWNAVRAAFDMRTKCRELASRLRAQAIPADLDIRVGLNTGHCTIGVFGSEVMRAYKSVGFAVNVAARLQSAGDPGTILCGFRTYALIKDRVNATQREPLNVKGAARPVEAWEILEIGSDGEGEGEARGESDGA